MSRLATLLLSALLVPARVIGAAGQVPADARAEVSIEELLRQGFAHVETWRFDEAATLFDEALERTRDRGLPRLEGDARRGRGAVLIHRGDLPAARAELEAARRLFEGAGDAVGVARVRSHMATIS